MQGIEIIALVGAFAAGYLLACWRVARKTGEPLRRVVIQGGPNDPEGPV